jgi:hypothetical protein
MRDPLQKNLCSAERGFLGLLAEVLKHSTRCHSLMPSGHPLAERQPRQEMPRPPWHEGATARRMLQGSSC